MQQNHFLVSLSSLLGNSRLWKGGMLFLPWELETPSTEQNFQGSDEESENRDKKVLRCSSSGNNRVYGGGPRLNQLEWFCLRNFPKNGKVIFISKATEERQIQRARVSFENGHLFCWSLDWLGGGCAAERLHRANAWTHVHLTTHLPLNPTTPCACAHCACAPPPPQHLEANSDTSPTCSAHLSDALATHTAQIWIHQKYSTNMNISEIQRK